MLQRIGPRLAIWAVVLCGFSLPGVGCRSRQEGEASTRAGLWSNHAPIQAADTSLPDSEYVSLGIAAHDRNWTADDMTEAASRLQIAGRSQPNHLPRHDSARSGRVFARIVARENLRAFRDANVPVSIRLSATVEFMQGLDGIYRLYLAALHEKKISGEEVVEINGARLRTAQLLMELLDEYGPTLSRDEPAYLARMESFARIRASLVEVLVGIVRCLSEPQYYGLAARRRLVTYSDEAFKSIVPRLPLESREALLVKLEISTADPHLDNLQPALRQLRDRVASAISSGD